LVAQLKDFCLQEQQKKKDGRRHLFCFRPYKNYIGSGEGLQMLDTTKGDK